MSTTHELFFGAQVCPARNAGSMRGWLAHTGEGIDLVSEPGADDMSAEFETALERACGVGLNDILAYAAKKAWYVLQTRDPRYQQDFRDVAQEAVMNLLHRQHPAKIEKWKGWVAKAVLNQVLMNIRTRNADRRPPDHLRAAVEDFGALPVEDLRDRMDEAIDASATKRLFDDAVTELATEDLRTVFLATYDFDDTVEVGTVEERSSKEVAEITGFHPSKVKRLWGQGRPVFEEAVNRILRERNNPQDEDE